MRLQNYELTIPEGQEDAQGYVALRHEQIYSLYLRNNHPTQCDAKVHIDGKYQGTWRLKPYQTARLEHPSHDQGRYTFYELNSKEGQDIGLDTLSRADLGLVEVTFTPEKTESLPKALEYERGIERDPSGARGGSLFSSPFSDGLRSRSIYSAGGTGLSSNSSQEYGKAKSIKLDETKTVTLNLRLVAKVKGPRPLTEAWSNQVPPPIV